MKQDIVTVLGARGSVPVNILTHSKYGGATICIFLRLGGQPIVLDAGTGILSLTDVLADTEHEIPLLLSHPHVDHLLGLPMCPAVFDPSNRFHIYAVRRGGLDAGAQVRALIAPPLWPVTPEQLPAQMTFHTVSGSFSVGPVQVDTLEGIHPGGVTVFRLSHGGKRVVAVTDCALTDGFLPQLTDFARDCDLLLCDGQYSESEWPAHQTYGHSTWMSAVRLAAACGAKQLRIIHHDPRRTDSDLDETAQALRQLYPNCAFARAGEEIVL